MSHKNSQELLRCWVWCLLVLLGGRRRKVTLNLQLALKSLPHWRTIECRWSSARRWYGEKYLIAALWLK